jgi:hypothetical protein
MPTKNEISEFSETVANLSKDLGLSLLDTIIHHCESTGMEVDVASTLISSALKSKIREQAQELNLLKKTSQLPL